MKHIKGLDTLRAFAVFFVIIQHFGVWFDVKTDLDKIIKDIIIPDGNLGVNLFFVLSGFLITSILLYAKNENLNNGKLGIIKIFYIRRSLRIFPIYYILLAILFFIKYPYINTNIGYYLTYTVNFLCFRTNDWNNFSHTWTLDIEEQFYLFWPWLVVFVKNKYFFILCFITILVGIVSTHYFMEIKGHIAPFMVYNCLDAFGLGSLYAGCRVLSKNVIQFEKIILIISPLFLGIYFYHKITSFYSLPNFHYSYIKTINSIISLALIILVVNNTSKWASIILLDNKLINFIGKISYGIYLYHYVYLNSYFQPLNDFINQSLAAHYRTKEFYNTHWVFWLTHVTIMIFIASVSYFLIEKPILQFKDRFKNNKIININ